MPFDPPFSGYIQPPGIPPDPTGDCWRGPPGPIGPPGPPGGVDAAPMDGFAYGLVNSFWNKVVPLTQLGMAVGQVPVFSNRGGRPSYELNSQWIINQAAPTGTQGADIFIRHDGSAVNTGTSANINGMMNMTMTVGANDATSNWGLVVHPSTSQTTGGQTLAAFLATDRLPGSNAHIWGALINVTCQTGLASSVVGQATLGQENDFASSLADDAANPAKWGGVGNRHLVHYIVTRFAGATQNEVTTGLWFGTTNSYIDSVIGFDVGSGGGCCVRQVVDTRGAIPPTGVTDPVASVRMLHEQIVDFNGGPSLNSAAGNYLQYTTSGTPRLRYMAGGTEVWSISDTGVGTGAFLPLAGGVVSGATTLGAGGTLTGTFAGAPFFSGNYISTGNPQFQGLLNVRNATTNTLALNLGTSTVGNDMSFNGAAGHRRAINWQTAGVSRWRMFLDATDGWNLGSFDTAGANFSGVLTVGANPATGSSNSAFTFGNAGALTLSGAGQSGYNFKHAYTGTVTSNLSLFISNISSDTVDAGNGRTLRGHYISHSYGGGSASGGRIALQIDFMQTGALATGSNAGIILNAAMNSPGGTSWAAMDSQLVGQNWNLELQQGARYVGVYKAMGEADISVDSNVCIVTVGTGSPNGTTYSLSFTTTATYQTAAGAPITTPVVITVVGSATDTPTTIAGKLLAAVQANDTLNQGGIGASAGQTAGVIFATGLTRAFSLAYADWVGMTCTPSATGGAGTLTVGAEVIGAGTSQIKGLMFVMGGNQGVRALTSTSMMSLHGSVTTASAGTLTNILRVEGGPGGGGTWPLDPYSTGFLFRPGGTLSTASFSIPQIQARMFSFADMRAVNFTLSGGYPLITPGFTLDGSGQLRIGSGAINRTPTGITVDAPGWVGSATVSSGGSGTTQTTYFVGDIGYDQWGGQYQVTATDSSGRVTTFTTLVAPSAPAGAAPATTQPVLGGSGVNWTNTVTWTAGSTVSIGSATARAMIAAGSGAAAPTTTQIPAGMSGVWKNTTDASVKLFYNDAGTMRSVALA